LQINGVSASNLIGVIDVTDQLGVIGHSGVKNACGAATGPAAMWPATTATAATMGRLTGSAGGSNRRRHAQGRDCCKAQEHTHFDDDVVYFIFHNFSCDSD
jgi:hypothetical protein